MILPNLQITPTSLRLTECVSIIQSCLSDVHFPVIGKATRAGQERAIWTIEMAHVTPPPHPLSLFFHLLRFHLVGSPRTRVVTQDLLVLPPPHFFHSSLPLTLSPSALCVSPVNSFLKSGVSSGFMLAASRGIHGNKPVHGAR